VDGIVYNSCLSCQQHEDFGFAAGHAQIIPNGFDTDGLQPDSGRGRAMRDAFGIGRKAVVVGHVARSHPMKDHASFLRAAVEVMHQRADVVCLLAGREVGLGNPALVGIVPPELGHRFRFVGERDDVADLMRAMDIFCLSSAWGEAFPNVLGEAMALGVPCVTTDVGDSGDIVDCTGEVVPPSDSDALAKGLLAMLERTQEERAALGRAARWRIETRYALPRVVEQYRGLYERVISK
jgi:glycosyltransferase involved in cell wall biosynthesis